jgi:hypothetical protein
MVGGSGASGAVPDLQHQRRDQPPDYFSVKKKVRVSRLKGALAAPQTEPPELMNEYLDWYSANAALWGTSDLHLLYWLSRGTFRVVSAAHAFPSISCAFRPGCYLSEEVAI